MKRGDKAGVIQSLNAIGAALNMLGRHSESLVSLEEGLGMARETGSQLLIGFMLNGLAAAHLSLKQYQRAADLLEQSKLMPMQENRSAFSLLSNARFGLGQYEAALKAAKEGLETSTIEEQVRELHLSKARALGKLGQTSEALADIRVVMESIEKARRTLVPTDFMKRAFPIRIMR